MTDNERQEVARELAEMERVLTSKNRDGVREFLDSPPVLNGGGTLGRRTVMGLIRSACEAAFFAGAWDHPDRSEAHQRFAENL